MIVPVIPMIHMGGTHGPDLLNQISTARQRVEEAITALNDATPHERDYLYRSDDWDQFHLAMSQHINRIVALNGVRNDLFTLEEAVADQIISRGIRKS